jgi:hypothetical protein
MCTCLSQASIIMVGGGMMKGYKDCVINVDLTEGIIIKEKLNPDYIKKYMGGEGYGIALLWNEMPHDAEPLSPDNILSFNVPVNLRAKPSGCNKVIKDYLSFHGFYTNGEEGYSHCQQYQ